MGMVTVVVSQGCVRNEECRTHSKCSINTGSSKKYCKLNKMGMFIDLLHQAHSRAPQRGRDEFTQSALSVLRVAGKETTK